jgi:hypothetical protein
MKNLEKEIVIRTIKIIDIGYASVVYIISAIILVSILNKLSGKYDKTVEEKKSTIRLFGDVILRTWIIAIFAYIVRNLFQMIPWPFEGVYGYKHLLVKEVIHSSLFVSFMVIFDHNLQGHVSILKDRLNIFYNNKYI